MNTIEKLHLEAIESEVFVDTKGYDNHFVADTELASSKSAEITEQVAVEFAEWCVNSPFHYYFNGDIWVWGNSRTQEYFTTKELYQEFLKTKE